mgnify:CR=1 FL=1
MKPLQHARNSARKHGGTVEWSLPIHNFFDLSKSAMSDMRHRAVLHSAFGIFLVERQFGTYVKTEDGVMVSVRDVGEQHVLEDLGFIPTFERWFKNMPLEDWMGGVLRGSRTKFVSMSEMKGGEQNDEQDNG